MGEWRREEGRHEDSRINLGKYLSALQQLRKGSSVGIGCQGKLFFFSSSFQLTCLMLLKYLLLLIPLPHFSNICYYYVFLASANMVIFLSILHYHLLQVYSLKSETLDTG